MNYAETLLNLIMDKSTLREQKVVNFTLKEVADLWNVPIERKAITTPSFLSYPTQETEYDYSIKDNDFYTDIIIALHKLKNSKHIDFFGVQGTSKDAETKSLDDLEKILPRQKPDVKIIVNVLKRLEMNIKNRKGDLVSFIKTDKYGQAKLKIDTYEPIFFSGERLKLIIFFYNAIDRNEWQNYTDISHALGYPIDRESIRKQISHINRRVNDKTLGKIKRIIKADYDDKSGHNIPQRYRWGL